MKNYPNLKKKIKECFKNNQPIDEQLIIDLREYYKKLSKERGKDKNWIKILRRFYTLFSYCQNPILLEEIKNHLIYFPVIAIGNKLIKYLYRTRKEKEEFNCAICEIIDYLYSEENLYPAVETNLIELILYFDSEDFDRDTLEKIKKLGKDLFFKNHYKPNSEYARALSTLII